MTESAAVPAETPACPGEWRAPAPGEGRSPCPALNSLANGGYLPRSGKVTVSQLVLALRDRLGIPPSLGGLLARAAMGRLGKPGADGVPVLDLHDLVLHGFIEHDASLTRRDARTGDAAVVVPSLVEQLLSLGEDGRDLTLEDLATAHQLRMAQSAAGGHSVSLEAGVLGTLEAALLYQVLRREASIPLADARELLADERVPAAVAPRRVGWIALGLSVMTIFVTGNVPLFRASRRARKLSRESLANAPPGCPFATLGSKAAGAPGPRA